MKDLNDANKAVEKIVEVGKQIAEEGNKLSIAMLALLSAMRSKTEKSKSSTMPKIIDPAIMKNKTQKGAKHKKGVHFLGRQILPITPAQYRHRHFGDKNRSSQ
jgi:hypothetical protein